MDEIKIYMHLDMFIFRCNLKWNLTLMKYNLNVIKIDPSKFGFKYKLGSLRIEKLKKDGLVNRK